MNSMYTINSHSKVESILSIGGGINFILPSKMPNIWFRLWQRMFLGWTWSSYT